MENMLGITVKTPLEEAVWWFVAGIAFCLSIQLIARWRYNR